MINLCNIQHDTKLSLKYLLAIIIKCTPELDFKGYVVLDNKKVRVVYRHCSFQRNQFSPTKLIQQGFLSAYLFCPISISSNYQLPSLCLYRTKSLVTWTNSSLSLYVKIIHPMVSTYFFLSF